MEEYVHKTTEAYLNPNEAIYILLRSVDQSVKLVNWIKLPLLSMGMASTKQEFFHAVLVITHHTVTPNVTQLSDSISIV